MTPDAFAQATFKALSGFKLGEWVKLPEGDWYQQVTHPTGAMSIPGSFKFDSVYTAVIGVYVAAKGRPTRVHLEKVYADPAEFKSGRECESSIRERVEAALAKVRLAAGL